MKNRIVLIVFLLIAIFTIAATPFVYPRAQMTDTCADGKILAVDVTNGRYKCITVPIILNSINVDLTSQTASLGPTVLYAVPTNGMFMITWTATITRSASVSSILGGTGGGLQVTYTNADDSTVVTTVGGLSGAINALNTVGGHASGNLVVYAKAGTNISYQYGYTSVGGTTMGYSLHVRLQGLQ